MALTALQAEIHDEISSSNTFFKSVMTLTGSKGRPTIWNITGHW